MKQLSRRDYLKVSAAVGSGFMLSPFAIGQSGGSANSKLNIALIGCGGIAKTAFRECRGQNVIALADVDEKQGAPGFEAFPSATRYKDFRVMLDKHAKELDLAIISTPDHTHFPATYMAMERGIAVQTQKPLTHDLWQARTLGKAAEKFKVQTVMGNQGHNMEGMRLIKDWYDAGLIGQVREVHAWTGRTTKNRSNSKTMPAGQPIPSTLDWDLWQGPALEREYNKTYVPAGWRWYWPYGLGGLGDIGCHTLDIPVYSMGLGFPTSVKMSDLDFRKDFDGKSTKGDAATYVYEFPAAGNRPACTVYWYEGGRMPKMPEEVQALSGDKKKKWTAGGCIMIGDKNSIISQGMRPTSPRILNDWMELRRNLPEKTTPRALGGPITEVIAAVKGDLPRASSHFGYAVPLTEIVILGTIANRSNAVVEYLPDSMTFKNPALNKYVKDPVRQGWDMGTDILG